MIKTYEKIKNIRGMTYVELIVVLSIMSAMATVVIFNYGTFQAKIEIKNLASDIALEIVEVQKLSLSGKLPQAATGPTWKPSYGVYFSSTTTTKFISFVDLNNSNTCSSAGCAPPSYSIGGEVLDIINITKGNTIPASGLGVSGSGCPATVTNLSIVFKRPNSTPIITSSTSLVGCAVSYFTVNILSPKGPTAGIRIYPSGRVQVN